MRLMWRCLATGKVKLAIECLCLSTLWATGGCREVIAADESAVDTVRNHQHSTHSGDVVYCDPEVEPHPGDLVLVYRPLIQQAAKKVYTLRQDAESGALMLR